MKKYILPGIAVVCSGIIIYQTWTIESTKDQMELVQQQMMELESINEDLQQSINGINDKVQTTLNEELGKSHLTKAVKFKFNKNIKDGYNLNVRVELKELKEDTKVLFMYKEESSNKWQKLELEEIGELSYSTDFDLPYDNFYEYKVVLKGETTESGDVEPIYKYEFIPEFPECSWYDNGMGITIDARPNTYEGEEIDDKIKKIEFIVSHNKKEKTYKAKYKEDPMYEDGNEVVDYDRRYELEISKDDFKGELDYIRVKVTYKSGIIDIVDITDKQMN